MLIDQQHWSGGRNLQWPGTSTATSDGGVLACFCFPMIGSPYPGRQLPTSGVTDGRTLEHAHLRSADYIWLAETFVDHMSLPQYPMVMYSRSPAVKDEHR